MITIKKNALIFFLFWSCTAIQAMESEERCALNTEELSALQACQNKIDTTISTIWENFSQKWQQDPTLADCQNAITCEQVPDHNNHMVRRFIVTSLLAQLQSEYTHAIETQRTHLFTDLEKTYPKNFPILKALATKYFNDTAQERLPTETTCGALSAFNDSCQERARELLCLVQPHKQLSTFAQLLEQQLKAGDKSPQCLYAAFLLGNQAYHKYISRPNNQYWKTVISVFVPQLELTKLKSYSPIFSDLFWAHHILKKAPEKLGLAEQQSGNLKQLRKKIESVQQGIAQELKLILETSIQNYIHGEIDQLAQQCIPKKINKKARYEKS